MPGQLPPTRSSVAHQQLPSRVSFGQVLDLPIAQLRPHPANLHKHSKRQIAQIARSIQTFNFTAPILCDEQGFILAGHGRWQAAQKLRLERVPVREIRGLTDLEKRAYILTDNKLTENAGWDRPGLADELSQLGPLLSANGLDVGLMGFEAAEVDALLGDLVDPEQDPADEIPPLPRRPVSRRGDIWRLNDHRLSCGDAKRESDLQALLAGERAAMVFTDPPYNLFAKQIQGRGRIKHRPFAEAAGELSPDAYKEFLTGALTLASKYSENGALQYVCIDWRHIQTLLEVGQQVYTGLKALVVWVKTNEGQGSFYRSKHELIAVFQNGDAPYLNNVQLGRHGRNRSNVWIYAGVNTFRAGRLDELAMHPTVKPVALVADAIKDCTRRGDRILDPFVGSGSTIMAADRVGRRGLGMDIDPMYVDAAVQRWQRFTKSDAVLNSNGQTFDEVAAARHIQETS
jgi:DNA modification methylase